MEEREVKEFFPSLGMGVGLRAPHFSHLTENKSSVAWFEALSENYIETCGGNSGRHIKVLEKIRRDNPVVLHGVSLSIGSADPLDQIYLEKLKRLAGRVEPAWISDHLCWTGVDGKNIHDLMPLPYTEEALKHVAERISKVQDFLGRQILIENVSSYVSYVHSTMSEWEFISEVAERADCGILLDINNIYVSAVNHGFDPLRYMNFIAPGRVGQFHLAGHTNLGTHLIDTHDDHVCPEVWDLYDRAIKRFGPISTLLEWDDNIPEFEVLEKELAIASRIQERALGEKRTNDPYPGPGRPTKTDSIGRYIP